jgi:hypothetical protein
MSPVHKRIKKEAGFCTCYEGLLVLKISGRGYKYIIKNTKDSNATTNDFKKIMEEVSGQNLTIFFSTMAI